LQHRQSLLTVEVFILGWGLIEKKITAFVLPVHVILNRNMRV
jgi:hypothetical protein